MIIIKAIKHITLITKHKWVVFKLCCKIGIPWRGLIHDLSKYSWTEFGESVKYYIGDYSPITEAKKANGYSKAWLHHKGRNKHHFEYWVDELAPDPIPIIPYKYAAEMICDKMAAGIIYEGKNWKKEYELSYWEREREKNRINENIKEFITAVFTQVAIEGINKTYTKRNIKSLYKKYCE